MNRRLIAGLVVTLVIVGAGVYVALNFLGQPTPPPPTLNTTPSDQQGRVIINEVKPTGDTETEFMELLIMDIPLNWTSWILTTYDDDLLRPPEIDFEVQYEYDIIVRMYSSNGQDETNINDGQVTLYLGRNTTLLDMPGDEVGLHDEKGNLVDFIRYGGGNGDEQYSDWPTDMYGPAISPLANYSLSLIGNLDDNPTAWKATLESPGEPNIDILRTTGDYGGDLVLIENGIRVPGSGGDQIRPPPFRGENVSITPGPGVNASVVNLIREHINFSLNFFREHGFTDPATAANNTIRIRVNQGGSPESTGVSRSNGEITINIGSKATKEELKVVGEHELMHLFQFRRQTDANGSGYLGIHEPDYWWDEGMAEFWGVYSMLKNYPNMTMALWNEMGHDISSLSWLDHFRDTNTTGAFHGWDHSWNSYMASFLFIKFINETYGTDTLLKVFNRTRYYGNNDSRNTDPKEEMATELGMTWAELYGRFLAWLLTEANNANGVPLYTAHLELNYTGDSIGDTTGVRGGGGAVIEEVEVSSENPFRVRVNTTGGQNWTVVVIVFYEDGTSENIVVLVDPETGTAEIPVDPNDPKKVSKIWVVKSVTEGAQSGRVTMRVIPNEETTYDNDTVGDTVTVPGGESSVEVIHVNNSQAFSVFLNWSDGSTNHWKVTIQRFWSDGSNDTVERIITDGEWPGYTVDPDAGPNTITKLVFIKENLNDTEAAVTMQVKPAPELPDAADSPLENNTEHTFLPNSFPDPYGGLAQGYLYIPDGSGMLSIELLTLSYPAEIQVEIVQLDLVSATPVQINPSSPQVNIPLLPEEWYWMYMSAELVVPLTFNITIFGYTPLTEMTQDDTHTEATSDMEVGDRTAFHLSVNSTTPFTVFANWSIGTGHDWEFNVLRIFSNGTRDVTTVRLTDTTWPGYLVKEPQLLDDLAFFVDNLGVSSNITLIVTPIPQVAPNAFNPAPLNNVEVYATIGIGDQGGFMAGYFDISVMTEYQMDLTGTDFNVTILTADLTVVQSHRVVGADSLYLGVLDIGYYYITIFNNVPSGDITYQYYVLG